MSNFVPPATACRLLGVSRSTLLRWQAAGRLPNTRRLEGGHRRYLLADLRACLKQAGK